MGNVPVPAGILATQKQPSMKTVTAFQTTDGEIFPDQEAAEQHEFFLANKGRVEEFLESELNPYKGTAHRSMVQGSIMRWELWRSKNAK